MILSAAIARLLAYFPHEEREVPDNATYPGRNAAVIGALNGALQEYYGTGAAWKRREPRGALLRAPTTVTVTVTNGSTSVEFGDDWQDWFPGCTIAINGASTDNSIVTGGDIPVASSVTITPASGSNNIVTYTANTAGAAGNDITITYATPATAATTDVSVATSAITVTPGTKARMVVSGVSTAGVNGTYIYVGLYNGKPFYGESSDSEVGGIGTCVYWSSTAWVVERFDAFQTFDARVTSSASTPEGLSFTVYFGTGTPTVTAGTSSAAQVIAAVNTSTPAAALVTASASGTVTGAVAAVAATSLAGGSGSSGGQELLYPHDGPSGTVSALVIHDCITLATDVQTVLTPVRIVDGPPLHPVTSPEQLTLSRPRERDYGHHTHIPTFPLPLRASQNLGTPLFYFVDNFQDDAYADPQWRLRIAPAPAAGMLLTYRARLSPPEFTSEDGARNIPAPNKAFESIILPIAAQRLSASGFFNQGTHTEEINRQAKLARTELFSMTAQANPGIRMRPGL